MLSSLIAILVLGLLVVVHELGHLVVARWSGVRILRFSVGFGPRLWTWTRGWTEYAISAIPLGGYVKMAGEQRSEQAAEPWEYLSKPVGTRAKIVFAGPLVNYLVALVSLWCVFVLGYPELLPVVGKVMDDMPAKIAGLQSGDRIVSVGSHAVRSWDEMTKLIYRAPEQPLAFVIERSGMTQTLTITPKVKTITSPLGKPTTVGLIGIGPNGTFASYRVGPVAAIGRTLKQQGEWASQTLLALWSVVSGRLSVRESMTGPIGIVYLTSEAVRMGLTPLLYLVSLFSLSLALFNVFPIPILDGGHLFFLLLERLRGKPVSVSVQERSAQVSFVLLMTFVLIVCVNDVNRFGLLEKLSGWVHR